MPERLKEFDVPVVFNGSIRVAAESSQQAQDVALSLVLAVAGTKRNRDGAVKLFGKHEMDYAQTRVYEQLPVSGAWETRKETSGG